MKTSPLGETVSPRGPLNCPIPDPPPPNLATRENSVSILNLIITCAAMSVTYMLSRWIAIPYGSCMSSCVKAFMNAPVSEKIETLPEPNPSVT